MRKHINWTQSELPRDRKSGIASMVRCRDSEPLSREDEIAFQKRIMELTYDHDDGVRHDAVAQLCPCHVKDNISDLWDRIFELVSDHSSIVRSRILHIVCDGSPKEYEENVIKILNIFEHDSDKDIRTKARRILRHYDRTGDWNIL